MDYREAFSEIAQRILPIFQNYRRNINLLKRKKKNDGTLLTQADIEIQDTIVSMIKKMDKNATIIAEEGSCSINSDGRTWIIDPIDGTKQFADADCTEFCTAICVMRDGLPLASMLLLPELGHDGQPMLVIGLVAESMISINGCPAKINQPSCKSASATRSAGSDPYAIEKLLFSLNYEIKDMTTSQSIDLLRTAADISAVTEARLQSFQIFYRENQHIWDGAPGICLNYIAGRLITDANGNELLPFSADTIEARRGNRSVLVAPAELRNTLWHHGGGIRNV